MGLQATETGGSDRILAGPYHPAFGHMVHCELFFDMARQLLSASGGGSCAVTFWVHPRSISRLRGLRNNNLKRLRREYGIDVLRTRSDPRLPTDGLRQAGAGQTLTYDDIQCDI